MPKPDIKIIPSDLDPKHTDVTVSLDRIVPQHTVVVVYEDLSLGVYEKGCFVGGSPVMIYA
jgi:hypothetical protein